ncbi:MAG: DinB family protein [Blastocatellia bacterium]|nr:DinB family protein [Blastocatellia bacterium]
MDLNHVIERMDANAGIFEGLTKGIATEQARWKPAPEKWSILEVVNHLYDEEREDFRQRLQLVLTDAALAWPPIAPQEWVTTRAYSERDLGQSVGNFLSERQKSLAWLRSLNSPNLERRHERDAESLSAGDLLASWLAHDFLHIRQLTRLHWEYLTANANPFQTEYAGPWKES